MATSPPTTTCPSNIIHEIKYQIWYRPDDPCGQVLENGEWVATGGTGAFYCKADANGNKLANGPCPVQMLIDERKTILADYEQLPHPAHDRPIEDFELEARRHEAGIRY